MLEQPVAAGSVLFTVLKTAHSIVPKPAWNTLQVGEGEHANFGQKAALQKGRWTMCIIGNRNCSFSFAVYASWADLGLRIGFAR